MSNLGHSWLLLSQWCIDGIRSVAESEISAEVYKVQSLLYCSADRISVKRPIIRRCSNSVD
jgi:hypothetical protein